MTPPTPTPGAAAEVFLHTPTTGWTSLKILTDSRDIRRLKAHLGCFQSHIAATARNKTKARTEWAVFVEPDFGKPLEPPLFVKGLANLSALAGYRSHCAAHRAITAGDVFNRPTILSHIYPLYRLGPLFFCPAHKYRALVP